MNGGKTDSDNSRPASATLTSAVGDKTPLVTEQPSILPTLLKRGVVLALIAAAVAGVAEIQSGFLSNMVVRLLGPPQVELRESYANTESTTAFDHSLFNILLSESVDADGWVDYQGIKNAEPRLQTYLDSIAAADPDALGRDDRLALLINAYNAFTLKLILEHYPLRSVKDVSAAERWDAVRWNLGGRTVSLGQIEHELIRPHFVEPRIHFALVCAAVGCPPLRNEAYTGARLEEQLSQQTTYVHEHDTWFQYRSGGRQLKLTQLYSWYGNDFVQSAGSVLEFVAQHSPVLRRDIERGHVPTVEWLDYDWTLNDVKNRSPR